MTQQAAKNATRECKPDMSYLPRIFCAQVSYVMMSGALKYGKHNYLKGHCLNALTAAAVRHAKAIEAGENIDWDTTNILRNGYTDPVTGEYRAGFGPHAPEIYHWACIAASSLMALHQGEVGTLKDDRFVPPKIETPAEYLERIGVGDRFKTDSSDQPGIGQITIYKSGSEG